MVGERDFIRFEETRHSLFVLIICIIHYVTLGWHYLHNGDFVFFCE